MDEKHRIIRQIFNTFSYRLIGFGLLFFRVFIIGKNFSIADAGAYDQILKIISIGLYAFGMNLHEYIIRIIPGISEDKKVSFFKTILLAQIVTALIVIAAIIVFKADQYFCSLFNILPYKHALRIGFLVIIAQITAMGFMRFYSAIKEIEYSNFIAFFNSGFWILLLLILWGIGIKITLTVFFFSWIFGSVITVVLGLKRYGFTYFFTSPIDITIIKKAYSFCIPLILSSIGYDLISFSSSFIISHYHSASATGIYFMSYRPLHVIYDFVTAVGITVFVPYVIEAHNKNDEERRDYFLSIMTKYTFIAAMPFIIGLLIARVDVINFLAKPEFLEAANVIPYIAVLPLLYIFLYPAHYMLFLKNKTFLIGMLYFTCGLFNILLNILFVPEYSYYAAAVATVITLLVVLIVFYINVRNDLHLKWHFIKGAKVVVVSIVSGIIAYYIYGFFNAFSIEFVRLILLGLFILLIYILGLYLFSVFDEREIDILKKFVNKVFN